MSSEKNQSISEIQSEVLEDFEFLGDWTERYRYIIELERELPIFPEEKKLDEFKITGCQSQVWLVANLNDKGYLQLLADSDAHIVRGLLALLLRCYNNRTPQ